MHHLAMTRLDRLRAHATTGLAVRNVRQRLDAWSGEFNGGWKQASAYMSPFLYHACRFAVFITTTMAPILIPCPALKLHNSLLHPVVLALSIITLTT